MNEQNYFDALTRLVSSASNRNPARTYTLLLETMHLRPFTWFVPNDDNRVEDGKEIRYELMNGSSDVDETCSFLEMLVALSRRAAFESYGDPAEWFWHLASNAGLREYSDELLMEIGTDDVRYILDSIVDRTYDKDGNGGLFPLKHAENDQRDVELWYQLSAYLLEGQGP